MFRGFDEMREEMEREFEDLENRIPKEMIREYLAISYLKAARVFGYGSIKTKYYAEAIREDEGIRPP